MITMYFYITLLLFLLGVFAIGGNLWIGGDNIPNQFLLEYIFSSGYNITNQWGLSGSATGLALWNQIPYAVFFKILYLFFGSYADSIFFGFYLVVFFIGWQKLFFSFSRNTSISYILPFVLLSSSYFWLLIHRNVLFQLVLVASIPWIILAIRKVFLQSSVRNWIILFFILLLSSGGFQNPGYSIPATILILVLLFLLEPFKKNIVKFTGVLLLGVLVLSPTICAQFNLLFNSASLSSDYWNTKILTERPLNIQKTTNTIDKVIIGYNSDTNVAEYGYLDGEIYNPWWFAPFSDSLISIFLYIPVALFILILVLAPKNTRKRLTIFLAFILFFIFMMKSSSGPGGEFFHKIMMDSGVMKMFRSPHLKFGFVYSIILCCIIALSFLFITKRLKQLFCMLLVVYSTVFFLYPTLTRSYIPEMQKTKQIPTGYFKVATFLQSQKSMNLGFLLPFNESTWDSTSWGYEGYHILHWMNTGISFWNRNGLSFNDKNKIGYKAGQLLNSFNNEGFGMLRKQGYDVIIYDKSSNRDMRFKFAERHTENLDWLLQQKEYITPIFSSGNLTVFRLNNQVPNISSQNLTVLEGMTLGIKELQHQELYFGDIFDNGWRLYLEPYSETVCERQNAYIKEETLKQSYIVKEGDDFQKIGKEYGIAPEDIIKLNPNWDRTGNGWLEIGQKIQILLASDLAENGKEKKKHTNYSVVECKSENNFYSSMNLFRFLEKSIFAETHKKAYDYSNQWTLDANYIKENYSKEYYKENSDGSIDIKVTLHFLPKTYFYLGVLVFGIMLLFLLGYLFMPKKKDNS